MTDWRNGVTVVRASDIDAKVRDSPARRATVFDFVGTGGRNTWIGKVMLPAGTKTGSHHHGLHEVAFCVLKGRTEVRWGERLEFAAEAGPGDLVYFAPYVPHQESNLDSTDTLDLLVVRSDNERIAIALTTDPIDKPERVF